MNELKEKRDLLTKQIIALDAKALVTGQDEYVDRAESKLEELKEVERQIIGGRT